MKNIKFITISIVLFLSVFVMLPAKAAAKKIWNMETEVIKNYGDLQLRLQSAFDRREPTKFIAAVSSFSKRGFQAVFSDSCSEYIQVKIQAGDVRVLNLERFEKSRSGKDLPIKEMLEIIQKSVSEQCDGQPEVIRVEFSSIYDREQKYFYEGTMQKSKGWKLEDGIVKTKFDDKFVFDLTSRDLFSTLGVQYKGGCQDEPVLPLAPMYGNRQEAAFAKPPTMADYMIFAKGVAKGYLKHCPNTELINFSLAPIPAEFECLAEEGCFVTASRENDWEPERSQFAIKAEEEDPVPDLAAMADRLANKDYEILHDYQNFFAFFYESFILIYSDHCRSHIKNPKGRRIFTIEQQVDGMGFRSNAKLVGEPHDVYIESAYEDAFDRYYGSWKVWGLNRYMSTVLKYQQQGRSPTFAVGMAMGFFTRNYNQLQDYVRGNCMDTNVQAAYHNMLEYAYMNKPMKPEQKKMLEDFKAVTDWLEEGLGIKSEGSSRPQAQNAAPQKSQVKTTAPKSAQVDATVQNSVLSGLTTGWKGIIDGKEVELVLWPKPNKTEQLDGYMYVAEHDCLIQAQVFKYEDKYAFTFGSNGIYLRENNCTKNTSSGNPARFQADGFIDLSQLPDAFQADWPFLIFLDRSLISDTNKPIITFNRSAISPVMFDFVSNYKHKFMKGPEKSFIEQLKVEGQ
ncbi:MAG: hypothetical protein KC684_06780 [Candidatus Omnitrophica bacterium]|nr:hypothetical protein [Candidatus Omnitrophota bacterium]